MSAANCSICLSHFTLDADKFAIFTCGHGFCTGCIDKLLSAPRPKCPQCRQAVVRRDVHPIFLELVDSTNAHVLSTIDGINKMGTDTPLQSVRKAGQKLGKILEDSKADGEILIQLLKAVEDFRSRIVPTFSKTESQKQQIQSLLNDMRKLRKDNQALQDKQKKVDSMQGHIVQLKTQLQESEENTAMAVNTAEVAKDELISQRTANLHLRKRTAELEQDNKRYKDQLERQSNYARTQKEKSRKLNKELADLKATLALYEQEREPLSTMTNEYNADFSHEVHLESSFQVQMTPSRSKRYQQLNDSQSELTFEGIPPPNFPSDWNMEGRNVLRKRNNGTTIGNHRRAANHFPIRLDRKGQPTSAVQLGPKSLIHATR